MPKPRDQPLSPAQIPDYLLTVARRISPSLVYSLTTLGLVRFPLMQESTIGRFVSRTVVGQQLSTKIAQRLWTRVVEMSRDRRSELPAAFTKASFQRLRNCGLSSNKAKTLITLGQAVRSGQLTDRRLQRMAHSERTDELMKLFGVGPWTCDMVSIFYFHCEDVWPEGDATVRKVFQQFVARGDEVDTVAQFAPYRSYLALSMWALANQERRD